MIHERFDAQVASTPDTTAIWFEDEALSYRALATWSQQLADWLAVTGEAQPGDRVAWLGGNDPFMLALLFACARTGTMLVPLNARLTAAEHAHQLEHCGARLAIAQQSFADHLAQAAPSTCRTVGVPSPAELAAIDAVDETGANLSDAALDDSAPLLLVYTSGTTGSPKGAVHTHRSLALTIDNGIESQGLVADDVSLILLPLFHVGGLNIQTLPILMIGATVVLHAAFNPGRFLADVERYAVTTSLLVPATIRAVLNHPDWPTADMSSIRGIQTGSSVVPPSLLRALNERDMPAGQVYGSTETGPTCVVLPWEEAEHVGAAGRAAPHSEIRIVDGELQVKGGHLFTRYWENPQATDAAFDGEWYRTGDLAHLDEHGYVRIDGRVDDKIISGGENIDPVEIEEALLTAPGVADIAIVAGADDTWGQVPVAFVVASGAAPTLADLRSHGEATLARFKLPAALHLVDELPRTALGKVQKFDLRARL